MMKRMFLGWVGVVLVTLLMSGCTSDKPIMINEVLQLKEGSKLYTNFNLWYKNPEEISCLNYQDGAILPFGTEIDDVKVDEEDISFTTVADQKRYTIKFQSNWQMIRIEKYMKRFFTTKPLSEQRDELRADFDKVYKGKYNKDFQDTFWNLRQGKILPGVTKKAVIKAYGYPSAHRTPTIKDNTWIYWLAPVQTLRVVFKKKCVIDVIRI